MKAVYKLMYWFILFQCVIILINMMHVFPSGYTLYSDLEMAPLQENITRGNLQNITQYFFRAPVEIPFVGPIIITIAGLVLIFGVGTLVAWKTQSYVPVVVAVMGVAFWSMMSLSLTYWKKLFTYGDNQALWSLGIILAIGAALAFMFAIVESATHGDS